MGVNKFTLTSIFKKTDVNVIYNYITTFSFTLIFYKINAILTILKVNFLIIKVSIS